MVEPSRNFCKHLKTNHSRWNFQHESEILITTLAKSHLKTILFPSNFDPPKVKDVGAFGPFIKQKSKSMEKFFLRLAFFFQLIFERLFRISLTKRENPDQGPNEPPKGGINCPVSQQRVSCIPLPLTSTIIDPPQPPPVWRPKENKVKLIIRKKNRMDHVPDEQALKKELEESLKKRRAYIN